MRQPGHAVQRARRHDRASKPPRKRNVLRVVRLDVFPRRRVHGPARERLKRQRRDKPRRPGRHRHGHMRPRLRKPRNEVRRLVRRCHRSAHGMRVGRVPGSARLQRAQPRATDHSCSGSPLSRGDFAGRNSRGSISPVWSNSRTSLLRDLFDRQFRSDRPLRLNHRSRFVHQLDQLR